MAKCGVFYAGSLSGDNVLLVPPCAPIPNPCFLELFDLRHFTTVHRKFLPSIYEVGVLALGVTPGLEGSKVEGKVFIEDTRGRTTRGIQKSPEQRRKVVVQTWLQTNQAMRERLGGDRKERKTRKSKERGRRDPAGQERA